MFQGRLHSQDSGKHLHDVLDLLQKHTLVEADISAQAERIKAVQGAAQRFTSYEQGECSGVMSLSLCDLIGCSLILSVLVIAAYKPCEPGLVSEKVDLLGQSYDELGQLAGNRRERLEDSRRLWQFMWDLGEEAAWIREQEQILASGDCGRDLTSALHLLSKHEAFRDEMAARYGPLSNSIAAGEALINEGHFGAPEVTERIQDIQAQWAHLEEVGGAHVLCSSRCMKLRPLMSSCPPTDHQTQRAEPEGGRGLAPVSNRCQRHGGLDHGDAPSGVQSGGRTR